MLDVALYRLSIPFAIITGCIAGLLAVLSWRLLYDSPFGTALKLFAMVMAIETIYHGGLLLVETETPILQLLLILGYGLVIAALASAISEITAGNWIGKSFRHRSLLFASGVGILFYAVGGAFSEVFAPELLHWIHGGAALFAIAGLYRPIHDRFENESWEELLLEDVKTADQPADWIMPIDNAILELLYYSGLVLTPAVIAYNIEYSRAEVNRRLTLLESKGLVERIERGKYTISTQGRRHIVGEATDTT